MPRLLNWEMLANPINWAVIFLMLTIAGLGVHFVMASQDQGK